MNIRDVTQIEIWGLILNTMGSAESGKLVAIASNEEALKKFYKDQLMEKPETINGWVYSFKEGPLRNYNPSGVQKASEDIFGHGIFSQWVNEDSIRGDIYRVDF